MVSGDGDIPRLFNDDEAEEEEGEATQIHEVPPLAGILPGKQRHAYLIVLAGSNVGAVFRLSEKEASLGRGRKCEIALGDTNISRYHAKLTMVGDDEVLLQDLQSTNGTFVGDQKVTSIVLHDGDRFQLGGTTLLKFSVSDEVEETFQRQLYESSVRDGLTGLNNRKHFDERFEAEFRFAARHGSALSLILIDVDHFKKVNDTHGHPAGDAALRALAGSIKNNTRTEDVVARYGGEEFAIIARGINGEQSLMFASRLRALIKSLPIDIGGRTIKLTISAGIAVYAKNLFPDENSFIAAADRALYAAKQQGRDRVLLAEECVGLT